MPAKKEKATPRPVSPEKVGAILDILDHLYPDAECSLKFKSPLELLVATILSAQCTDERVNMVTPGLFKKYPSAEAFADAPIEDLEEAVKSTGFYRNKAKNIKACCRMLVERFGGSVPGDLDTLVELPGVGRKTANVILGNSFGIPGIVVDTHVGRVTQRLGLTQNKDPEKVEQDLMKVIPRERWTLFCHQIIQLGRAICQARKPKMEVCPLRPHCDYALKGEEG
ncbi:MAG: endonuclease III [Acidobacteriota bacterium]